MTCQYCGGSHSAFDPCPEMLAASAATVAKHTLGTKPPVTVQQLAESMRIVESLMRTERWTLLSPQGEVWTEHDPKKLVHVLLIRLGEFSPRRTAKDPALGAQYGSGRSVGEAMDNYFSKRKRRPVALTHGRWKNTVILANPTEVVRFTSGEENSYGEVGTVTAHIGPDMQSDVVGVWVPGSHCSVGQTEYKVTEDDNPSFG